MEKEKCFISVVFYVRNYEKYIEKFLTTILSQLDNHFEHYELICVNNDSSDTTIKEVKDICYSHNEDFVLNIINIAYCRSIEEAMSAGIDFAIGDFVYQFNSIIIDYEEDMIFEAYKAAIQNNDIVIISPNKKYTLQQKIYYSIYNLGVKKDMRIQPERFHLLSRRVINRMDRISNSYTNNVAIFSRCGLKSKTICYTPSNLYIKYDKSEKSERLYKALESLIVYTNSIPYLMIAASIIFLVLCIINACLVNLLVSSIFFLCFILISLCTVILQYLHILINLNFKKQIHLIKSVDKVVK